VNQRNIELHLHFAIWGSVRVVRLPSLFEQTTFSIRAAIIIFGNCNKGLKVAKYHAPFESRVEGARRPVAPKPFQSGPPFPYCGNPKTG
jgi:hypothetical protein